MDDDSANTDGPSHINRRLRNKVFNHRAADMSDSAHDIANQLVSRRPDESDHDDGEVINTTEMREQLLVIQAQIEDIENRLSFTSAGTVRWLPWIRPPEYTL